MKYEYYLNKDRKEFFEKFHICNLLNDCFSSYENCLLLPIKNGGNKLWGLGGAIDNNDNFIKESENGSLFGGCYEYKKDDIKYINETVIYFGPFIKHWGHFICDEINRLWFLEKNNKKYKIAYLVNDKNVIIDGNFLEVLNCIGIKSHDLIQVSSPTKFSKVIIPSISFCGNFNIDGGGFSSGYSILIEKIRKNALLLASEKYKYNKVYFSRSQFQNAQQKEKGENVIVKLFKNNGFKILIPEEMSFFDQVYVLNNSKTVVMISGSISHTILFSKASNIVILNKMYLLNPYQLVIDNISKSNSIAYIDCFFNKKPVLYGMGPFIITTTKYLKDFINKHDLKWTTSHLSKAKTLLWFYIKYKQIYSNKLYKQMLKQQQLYIKNINLK